MGNEALDAELRAYHDDLDELTQRALNGDIAQADFEDELETLVMAAIAASFLLAGGDEDIEGAIAQLEEQRTIARESIEKISADIYSGEFSERDATDDQAGQTAESGAAKLDTRLTLWTGTIAGVYAIGQMHSPPEVVDGVETEVKFIWVLGNTVQHCSDCLRLEGQVHTADEWRRAGIQPQSPDLECGGWHCDCRWDETGLPGEGFVF